MLHGTPGTLEYQCIDHVSLDKMPDPAWWKQQSKDAKGKPLLCIIDDYSTDVGKDEKKNIEMMLGVRVGDLHGHQAPTVT